MCINTITSLFLHLNFINIHYFPFLAEETRIAKELEKKKRLEHAERERQQQELIQQQQHQAWLQMQKQFNTPMGPSLLQIQQEEEAQAIERVSNTLVSNRHLLY